MSKTVTRGEFMFMPAIFVLMIFFIDIFAPWFGLLLAAVWIAGAKLFFYAEDKLEDQK